MKTELLSPAKDKETAIAAIDCGADAVYIGAPAFGARKNAANSIQDIKDVVDYAHKFWAKVFVTMNTILTDKELDDAIELVKELGEIGVDALIVQDLGILEKLMEITPPQPSPLGEKTKACLTLTPHPNPLLEEREYMLPIHMSTQCDNYLKEKVKFFNEVGVSRVVLARELSLEEIKKIHQENPDLELEAFVHGALCVSMSGQCYLSQFIGGRSANRGECAQPCRKLYSVETADGEVIKKDIHALCLKDFNASNLVQEMANAGVYSFKIEGRLKDINYVKNITAYYRQKLGKGVSSGRSVYPFIPNPEKSFNRGFTEYFLKDRCDCFNFESPKSRGEYLGEVVEVGRNWVMIRTEKVVHAQDGIYCNGEGFAVNKVEFDSGLTPHPDPLLKEREKCVREGVLVTVYPNRVMRLKVGDELYRNFDAEFEKEVAKVVKRQIGVKVEIAHSPLAVTIYDEDGVCLTKEIPQGEKANNPEKMKETFIKQFNKTGEGDFYIEDIKIATELPFMPVSAINQLRRELFEELMSKRIEVYNTKIKEVQKPLRYAEYFLKEVDYRANVHNSSARKFYEKCGAKVLEPSFETKQPQRPVALMRCKHCIKYALNMCKSPKNLILRDSHGNTYPLKFNCKNCEMSVMNK